MAYLALVGCMQEKTVLTLSSDSLSFSALSGTQTVTVESNAEWSASCQTEWITAEAGGSHLKVTVETTAACEPDQAKLSYLQAQ